VVSQTLHQLGVRLRVGEQILDSREAVGRRGAEALEERVLAIHHRQVRGELRHG